MSKLEASALEAFRPTTSADHIAAALREAIAVEALAGGEALRQDELAERFGISRMPIRDALRQLETEGLVTIHPTRGCFVTPMEARELREIFQLREILEVEALRSSLASSNAADFAEAERLMKRIDLEEDERSLSRLNLDFHLALYRSCGNTRLLGLIEEQHNACYRYVRAFMKDPDYGVLSQQEHRRILAAAVAKDARGAIAELRRHLRGGAAKLTARLEGRARAG